MKTPAATRVDAGPSGGMLVVGSEMPIRTPVRIAQALRAPVALGKPGRTVRARQRRCIDRHDLEVSAP